MDTSKTIKGYQIKQRIGKGGCGAVYLAQKENENPFNENRFRKNSNLSYESNFYNENTIKKINVI